MSAGPVHVLETTVRDGSYEVNFQFTREQVVGIVHGLDQAGLRYIEVGHGLGVGLNHASTRLQKRLPFSAYRDEEYLAAIQSAMPTALIGVILTISEEDAPCDYIDFIASKGISFIRLAAFPSNVDLVYDRIERAKSRGLVVSLNLVQTYAMDIERVEKVARKAADLGADWLYIIDSAGCMTAAEIRDYVKAALDASGLRIGLHAHNSLGLGLSNCLAAVEAGATLIDGTLNGVGRGGGNPATEQLVLALQNIGHEMEIDTDLILNLGQAARSLWRRAGNDAETFISGATRLHTRVISQTSQEIKRRNLKKTEFYFAVAKEAKRRSSLDAEVFAPEIMETAAKGIEPASMWTPSPAVTALLSTYLRERLSGDFSVARRYVRMGSKRTGKQSVLHLPGTSSIWSAPCHLFWESMTAVGCTLFSFSAQDLEKAGNLDAEILVIDPSMKKLIPAIANHRSMNLSTDSLILDAVMITLQAIRLRENSDAEVQLIEECLPPHLVRELELRIVREGGRVARSANRSVGSRVLISGPGQESCLEGLGPTDQIILLGRGPDARRCALRARNAGARVYAPGLLQGLTNRVDAILQHRTSIDSASLEIAGIRFVSSCKMPGPSEASVDVPGQPSSIVDLGELSLESVCAAMAQAWATSLMDGSGSL